jgi:hypothetical protein
MSWKNAIRLMVVAIALTGIAALSGVVSAQVAIGISVGFAPPEIPVYEQPICPAEGYIWTPGYWAWDDDSQDYYWVPGTWVLAPQPGYLWTPGYWGWGGNAFFFHEGYWGPVVGFYGGINYGFGYFGRGYEGGRWEHDHFYYNREVNRINEREIHNVYNTRVEYRNETRVSYNGGNGGVNARASREEENTARERHIGAVSAQQEHVQAARSNRELRASENHGRPSIAATERPGAFSGGGVVAARSGGNYNPPANRGPRNDERTNGERNTGGNNPNRPPNATSRNDSNANRPANTNNHAETYSHSREVPQHSAPQVDNNVNQRYQQQQEKLVQKQNQEHQRLQQKQEQEHQRATQQRAPAPKQQQMEQRHQQQTQQMEQKHTQQQQKVQQRQAPPPHQSESKPHQP